MRDATHITLVIDRSGSMSSIKTDAEGAINSFVGEQQKVPGDCRLKLVEFDAPGHGADWYHVVTDADLAKAPTYVLNPRGNTALLDAVARAINETGQYLANLSEDLRPDKVIFVIQTDGQENSSKEHTWEQVAEMIKVQTEQFAWQFVFLGMGQDSWGQGQRLGVSNVVRAGGTGEAHAHTHSVMNAYAADYRVGAAATMDSMADLTVDDHGQVTNARGQRVNSATGKVEDDDTAKS
jgi:hypothetical protein